MTFVLVVAAAVLAFFCGRRYSEWIYRGAVEMQAGQIVKLESELRALYLEMASLRAVSTKLVLNAYSAARRLDAMRRTG